VQWGAGPSHRTLDVLTSGALSTGALRDDDEDDVCAAVVSRVRQLLTSSGPLRVRVAVHNPAAAGSADGAVAVIESLDT
jgi:hypothetical protein